MYQITFAAKYDGASEQKLLISERFLNSQLRILIDSNYKVLRVKYVEDDLQWVY